MEDGKRVLIVSDFPSLMGDLGIFVAKHGYEGYYGPVGTTEITRELLLRLPDVDILWLATNNLDVPVSLSEYKDPKYGDRRMWIVRPTSSLAALPKDILQYQIIPNLDIKSLSELSLVSGKMRRLAGNEIHHRAQRLGEITREEFFRLGMRDDGKGMSDLARAYDTWATYRNILSLGRRMEKEGEDPEEVLLLTRYLDEIVPYIKSLSPRQLEELLRIAREYGDDYNHRLILARLLFFFSDDEVMDLWELSFLDEGEQLAGVRELKFAPAIKSIVARNLDVFTSRGLLLTAVLLAERDELLRELEFDESDGEMVDRVIRFVMKHAPLDSRMKKNLQYLESVIDEG